MSKRRDFIVSVLLNHTRQESRCLPYAGFLEHHKAMADTEGSKLHSEHISSADSYEQGLFERCTQNGDKTLIKCMHKAGASGASGPEAGGSQAHSL